MTTKTPQTLRDEKSRRFIKSEEDGKKRHQEQPLPTSSFFHRQYLERGKKFKK